MGTRDAHVCGQPGWSCPPSHRFQGMNVKCKMLNTKARRQTERIEKDHTSSKHKKLRNLSLLIPEKVDLKTMATTKDRDIT